MKGAGVGLVLAVLLAGCTTAPKEYAPLAEGDCAIEALGGVGELSGGFGDVFAVAGGGRGGSLTVRNPTACGDMVNVWHVSPNGTIACVGDWCPDTPPAPTVRVPADAVRIQGPTVGDFEAPAPKR